VLHNYHRHHDYHHHHDDHHHHHQVVSVNMVQTCPVKLKLHSDDLVSLEGIRASILPLRDNK
jgi:ferredoxin-like protein FixX